MLNFLQNYEINKLSIGHPDTTNVIILMILAILIVVSVRKKSTTFLDISQTNQAKGLAILLIIIGHLWVHISKSKPALVWSDSGIALFLILSGYGLTRSELSRSPRYRRVFLTANQKDILLLLDSYGIDIRPGFSPLGPDV